MKVSVKSHAPAASLPNNQSRGGEVGLRARLETLEKIVMFSSSRIELYSSIVQPSLVPVPTTLPHIPFYFNNKGRCYGFQNKELTIPSP